MAAVGSTGRMSERFSVHVSILRRRLLSAKVVCNRRLHLAQKRGGGSKTSLSLNGHPRPPTGGHGEEEGSAATDAGGAGH